MSISTSDETWNQINLWYYIAGAFISVMLCVSEILAWVDRIPANAITQLPRCFVCKDDKSKEDEEVEVDK